MKKTNLKFIKIGLLFSIFLLVLPVNASNDIQIEVQALMPGMVVLMINGSRETLKTGNKTQGVKLISSTTKAAVLEVNGVQKNYQMGTSIGTSFTQREKVTERVVVDQNGMFSSYGSINGQSVKFLVDTGATSVAMSEKAARKLGIQYQLKGTPTRTSTASGIARAWSVKLKTVSLGKLLERNVQGIVVEGNFPRQVLLGMSFLNKMKVEKEGGTMKITSKR